MDPPQTILNCIQGFSCCVQGGSTPPTPDKYSPGKNKYTVTH